MCNKNSKLRKVMLITAIIGLAATIPFAIFVDIGIDKSQSELLIYLIMGHWAFYCFEYLIIYYGFKRKFGRAEARWTATLCFFPMLIEPLAAWILGETHIINFLKWYPMIGITISVLIFEYKLFSHDKKCK